MLNSVSPRPTVEEIERELTAALGRLAANP
jgi:hypothetical protein